MTRCSLTMYFSCLDPDSGSDFKLENFLSAPSETFDPHYGMYCLASKLCSFTIYTFATLSSITQGRIQGPHPILSTLDPNTSDMHCDASEPVITCIHIFFHHTPQQDIAVIFTQTYPQLSNSILQCHRFPNICSLNPHSL